MMGTLSVAVAGGAAGATQPAEPAAETTDAETESSAYDAGTHVTFDTSSNAVVGYSVGGERVFENVTVVPQSDHHSQTDPGADIGLAAVVNLSGIGLDPSAQSETRADIATDGSASISAHDIERGILTVNAGEDAQYVELNLSGESNAEASGDGDRIVIESDERSGVLVVAVDTQSESADRLEMTVDRARSEGTVVIATVSEAALETVGSAEDLAVTVDGEAAAEASSHGELEGGIGEGPRYMVTSSSEASATADVLVAVDHFSEREVAIEEDEGSSDSVPGFGVTASVVAALTALAARIRQ